jgi:hypothetical protein
MGRRLPNPVDAPVHGLAYDLVDKILKEGPTMQTIALGSRWLRLFAAIALACVLASCSGIKLVADYDADAAKSITDASAEVFAFYDRLIEAKARARSQKLAYSGFNEDWGKIETRIRVLMVREEARPLNSESQRVAGTILEFWQKYREAHRKNDDYAAALLPIHRDRFQRLFTAALLAEKAKRLADPDSNPKLDGN